MERKQKLDLIAKMTEEFADTPEIVEFLTGIADRLKKPPDAVEFPAESYDVEILWECSLQATLLRERIRKEELVLINDETGAGKIVSVAPPGKVDVAKERWEIGTASSVERQLYIHDGEDVLVEQVKATPGQIRKMVAASEMLDVLKKVAKGAAVIQVDNDKPFTTIPSGLLLDINEVIKQARGGE